MVPYSTSWWMSSNERQIEEECLSQRDEDSWRDWITDSQIDEVEMSLELTWYCDRDEI